MRIFLFVLLFLTGCTASSPATPAIPTSTIVPASPTAESPFVNVTTSPASITAGNPISMAVELDVAATELSLLRLSITYPSDHVQTIVESIYGSTATLSWIVPPDSDSGTATYRLSSEGCGCGPGDKGATSIDQNSTISGEFIIE